MSKEAIVVRTIEDIASDYLQLSENEIPVARSLVDGRKMFIEKMGVDPDSNKQLAKYWLCQAHEGTLDKLERLFVGGGTPSHFEIVAGARNLFENLVWCKLFSADIGYGLVFYEQLLIELIENAEARIAKIDSEIELFAKLQADENKDFEQLSQLLVTDEIDSSEFNARHAEIMSKVDYEARLEFAIYGAAATFNGYGYQQYLLTEEIRPQLKDDLRSLQVKLEKFNRESASVSDSLVKSVCNKKRINWSKASKKISMQSEYDFIYSFASKMLHSKAISTVPGGGLSESEAILLFEYAYVAAVRILKCLGPDAIEGVPDIVYLDIAD